MRRRFTSVLFVTVGPSLVASLLFYLLLGYRRDYLGHYAAGYGGTLAALAIVLAAIPSNVFHRLSTLTVFPCALACIAAGAVTESTVFRIAKFDEIDFFNQSLGAVLAGLAAMFLAGDTKPTDASLWTAIVAGAAFLIAGGYFALF